MENLLNPDIGLMIWTVITFAGVVLVLGRFAWKPILAALEAREKAIADNVKAAEESRQAAEKLKADYDKQLADTEAKTRSLISDAQKEAQKMKDTLLKTAQEESERLTEKTRQQLAQEQQRLIDELRSEVAEVSVKATEKLLKKSVDAKTSEKLVEEAIGDFEKWSSGKN